MSWNKDDNDIFKSSKEVIPISYPKDGNNLLLEIEENSEWFKQRNELILSLIKKYKLGDDFLDIGGGNGYQAKAIQEANIFKNVVLIEPGEHGCINAKKRGLKLIYKCIFQDFPFRDYNIKAVGLFDVIEHIENDTDFLKDLRMRITPETYVFINVPACQSLWSETDIQAGHFRRYSKRSLKKLASDSGFEIIEKGYFFSYYFIPVFLLRSLPFLLGVRKGDKKLHKSKVKNHSATKKSSSLINFFHKRSLKKVASGKGECFGTSLYAVIKPLDDA
jgi:hypothetical protein